MTLARTLVPLRFTCLIESHLEGEGNRTLVIIPSVPEQPFNRVSSFPPDSHLPRPCAAGAREQHAIQVEQWLYTPRLVAARKCLCRRASIGAPQRRNTDARDAGAFQRP